MSRSLTIAALAVTLATAATTAYAAGSESENDAMAVSNANISLSQAIQAAEQKTHGRASRAEYENTSQGRAYDVEVVSGSKVFDVRIDAQDGSVLSSTADPVDHDDEGDEID